MNKPKCRFCDSRRVDLVEERTISRKKGWRDSTEYEQKVYQCQKCKHRFIVAIEMK